ncbi:MAG: N-acetylmuramoyl-L-alanine amidase [Clostridia bacterium]|nr:N-acetylmuramoyl-L-alanine amidase [Clostridia bacterium]
MNIIENDFSWKGSLEKRTATDHIILHHRAGEGDAKSIHQGHLKNGWSGMGYHFYIRKDGSIFRGRPIDTVGAHTLGKNAVSVGICFEGNYHDYDKKMPKAQLDSGKELISYLRGLFPDAQVKRHCDFQATACPGQYFPFDEVSASSIVLLETPEEITKELSKKHFNIDDPRGFILALTKAKKENSPMYWGYYKLVNPTKNRLV